MVIEPQKIIQPLPYDNKPRHDGFGLGRLAAVDLRDHRYLARPMLPKKSAGITFRTWTGGKILDQGNSSQCTSYASLQFLMTSPVRNVIDILVADQLYKQIQQNDEWPGEEPEYEGSSVRASMKVLQQLGYVPTYHWAYDIKTCVEWVLQVGPMVFGTIWTEEMFYPDSKNYIHIEAAGEGPIIVGGHAYAVVGMNKVIKNPDKTIGRGTILNSWGNRWGKNGRAYISLKDLEILLNEDGEAACATEVKKASTLKQAA